MYAIRSYYVKTIGLQGKTAARIKKHTDNWHLFDSVSLKGKGKVSKEYYGLPWPCWDESHPGSPVLYNINLPVSQGGMGFRNRFGVERNGVSLLSAEGSAPKGSRIKGGYAEITSKNIEELAGVKLNEEEKKAVEGKNWNVITSYSIHYTKLYEEKLMYAIIHLPCFLPSIYAVFYLIC